MEDDAIRVLRLAGGKANAMDGALLDGIERLIDDFERGPARAAVLTGYERFFSAGLALPLLIDLDRGAMREFIERFARAMTRVLACEKPIVAAINGHAIAGGCVLALMCDWRICVDAGDGTGDGMGAGEGAGAGVKIGLNEVQLGIGLPAIVIEPLRAQVPAASLVPVALEGRLFTPREARALGLVHELATPGELAARAEAKARELAAPPGVAVAQIKRALRAPILEAVARHASAETERWLDSWFSAGAQARLRAAVAGLKRPA
ncbi:MAG TPA: enoyl-CoA hydratase/isomerase family protein [Gemmatimonadaceae bacterium]|nr:enoyl-CoA hydratase/isomerase family protein [Gemmatimonadaceae bacterium]